MSNNWTTNDIIGMLITTIVIISLIALMAYDGIQEQYAAEDAANYCRAHGYDNYDSFSRTVLSSHALGIRCSYASKQMILATANNTGVLVTNNK